MKSSQLASFLAGCTLIFFVKAMFFDDQSFFSSVRETLPLIALGIFFILLNYFLTRKR